MKVVSLIIALLFANIAHAAEYLDTQYGPDGLEVHLLKASVANNVLTVAFMIENSSDDKVEFQSMAVDNVLYTTQDKKYPVLKDADDKYLASTITYEEGVKDGFIFAKFPKDGRDLKLDGGSKKVGWVKFEAPDDASWPIEISMPGITPFSVDKPAS